VLIVPVEDPFKEIWIVGELLYGRTEIIEGL